MPNTTDRIDFALVRKSVSMEMLIIHFGLFAIKREGSEVRLKCPFHGGKSDNSMAINLERNSFYCFGCKARGDCLEFVARYEDCSLHEAALLIDEWFCINGQNEESREEVSKINSFNNSESVPLSAQHLIASIEFQLSQLKQLILKSSR